MAEKLVLATLNVEQIENAKLANGSRKKITHAVICGEYGQLFGSEKFCRKYFDAWSEIFPHIFHSSSEVTEYEIGEYLTTFNLVNKLILLNEHRTSEK